MIPADVRRSCNFAAGAPYNTNSPPTIFGYDQTHTTVWQTPFFWVCSVFCLLNMECCVVPGGACVIPALPFKQAPIEKPIPADEKAARKADEQGQ